MASVAKLSPARRDESQSFRIEQRTTTDYTDYADTDSVPPSIRVICGQSPVLRTAGGHSRCCVVDLKESAHFLQLRCLLLKLRGESCHSLLQFLHFPVFFEEFVEQHGVDLLVAHGFRFAISVRGHKVWIDLGHFLGDQAKRERARRINLVLVAK